ncbi:MAG: UDP-glucose/GDP-mannose dehydrogenase family protein, partial [Elusimicrobia bacterium]|nr:UDP-glucose/GDP-mannose dehydrogenase family protein [Elusimicrobiota bacterium]
NEHQKDWPLRKLEEELWNLEGKTVAVLGLSFKPETDDLRFAPSLEIVAKLQAHGVKVAAYDPVAMPKARTLLANVRFAKDAYDAVTGADCLMLVTEWKAFQGLDFAKVKRLMRHPIVLDGRNFFDAAALKALGFTYRGVGRAA